MDNVAHEMAASPALKAAVWGLGSHYPGASGTSDFLRGTNISLWSAEDYSTYSDATGAGCWGRLLVQNLGWDLTATISWYLIGSFARGMDYDSDGDRHLLLRLPIPALSLSLCIWRSSSDKHACVDSVDGDIQHPTFHSTCCPLLPPAISLCFRYRRRSLVMGEHGSD